MPDERLYIVGSVRPPRGTPGANSHYELRLRIDGLPDNFAERFLKALETIAGSMTEGVLVRDFGPHPRL